MARPSASTTPPSRSQSGTRLVRGKNAKRKIATLQIMSVPNNGTMRSPEETKTNVTIPDSITNAQNATIPNAINDCPSIITGFARATKGIINNTAMAIRALMLTPEVRTYQPEINPQTGTAGLGGS